MELTKRIQPIILDRISFTSAYKVLKDKGNLVYEYNPFRNYRLSEIMFEYNNHIYSYEEIVKNFNITISNLIKENPTSLDIEDLLQSNTLIEWCKNGKEIENVSECPIIRRPGELVDFDTSELSFDLNHPVNIIPLYSYDNSVNLIINDGKNLPRLINSRFSAVERNTYLIVDRKGDNDTNIYDQGDEFDIDTSLLKKTKTIPLLSYLGTFSSGNLSIGNYHFYFKYVDADGNESDFIAESGLVSIYIGNTPYNMHTGVRDENSHKGISFLLKNLDSGYLYISVYYTKTTADILENYTTRAFRIEQKYLINSAQFSNIKITGFEEVSQISTDEINMQYQEFGATDTQAICLNRLFFGNVKEHDINYKELSDISLRFLPYYVTSGYEITKIISPEYEPKELFKLSYYDSKFIYNNVGYWPGEIYRFGIVYILDDGTLTPVFNVRGIKELPCYKENSNESSEKDIKYSQFDFLNKEGLRKYITYNEETNIINDLDSLDSKENLENCKGVVRFPLDCDSNPKIYGILFILDEKKEEDKILDYLKNLGIRGYFFVRLKRIPTILCLALTIGADKESKTPVIPYNSKYISECFLPKDCWKNSDKNEIDKGLTNEYLDRVYESNKSYVNPAAICPDYDVDYPYYNTLFSGDTFTVSKLRNVTLNRITWNPRHYYDTNLSESVGILNQQVRIQSVEDNQKLVAIDDIMFSARAGEAEEVTKFEYASIKSKNTKATNLLRGSFGPFLGMKGYNLSTNIINILIPGYIDSNIQDYFLIRYNDKASFYAISDRININDYNKDSEFYRGDCYICLFTHRINRNFQDPSAPTNDLIVDPKCWENWKFTDGVINTENIDKINLGDINAILLGQWITFTLRSTKNLNIRTLDDSNVDEAALFGRSRGFYPYLPLSTSGAYKIPEACCYNKGFEVSTSLRWNFEVPDVPFLKNDFTNRISYSDIHVNDAFRNGFRVFLGNHYRDYPKTYGSITKLIELQGNLLCVFEHGVGLIPVNERTVAGDGSGGNVYINTSNVLPENPKIISDTFGSLWRDSIIKTPRGVYGVDTIGKKIWRTNGETFECISDFRVQEFLNQNISLTERELEPIIGIRNVKTHYNKFKGDVMFTFYDNLYGFEEKVWNICFNENLLKWVTFYSWVPSYSENIYNQYFSFDRNTSKWITKLGISRTDSSFADGVTLENNIIDNSGWSSTIHLSNRNIPKGDGVEYDIEYELVRDNYGNYKLFNDPIKTEDSDGHSIWKISLKKGITYELLCSEYYARIYKEGEKEYILDDLSINENGKGVPLEDLDKDQYTIWKENIGKLEVYKNDTGRRINLSFKDKDRRVRGDKVVILLNIKAKLKARYTKESNTTLGEAYVNGYNDRLSVDSGYYESVVAIIPKYNMQFLTTDFWKHGQAGIIDIADKIYPTYWYGKQHPFEFEFVVADNPDKHKIFDNLEIISNKAAPESFHYEIVGECYDFAKDKKNMYIRLEATKELYLFNGSDIVYNPDYKALDSDPRLISGLVTTKYDKSTIFPLYYCRKDTINEIEDYYHLYGHKEIYGKSDKNFSSLSGAEIVRYPNLGEYRIWNHAKAVDIHDFLKGGRMRGNMQYKEDKWDIQINPINLVQKNEDLSDWTNVYGDGQKKMVPAECNLFTPPAEIYNKDESNGTVTLPSDWERNVVSWGISDKINKEVKLKDKFIKIRVRYSGKDLAIISALKTLYSISYA